MMTMVFLLYRKIEPLFELNGTFWGRERCRDGGDWRVQPRWQAGFCRLNFENYHFKIRQKIPSALPSSNGNKTPFISRSTNSPPFLSHFPPLQQFPGFRMLLNHWTKCWQRGIFPPFYSILMDFFKKPVTWFNKTEFPEPLTHDNSGKGDRANMVRSEEAVAPIFLVPHVIFVLPMDDPRIV